MNIKVEQPVAVICIFIWIGFVCAISFMESWLKFKAPGVTRPIGLGIGRVVFNALNKMEWLLAFIVLWSVALNETIPPFQQIGYFLAVLVILALQSFWLLPQLDIRAKAVISGLPVKPSHLHLYFIIAETLKLCGLVASGIFLFKQP